MATPHEVAPPMLFEHCQTVWQKMFDEATEEFIDDTETRLVWEGHTTKLFRDLHFSTPYYSTVLSALKNMGCIEQIRRGGNTSKSKWLLVSEPDMESYDQQRVVRPQSKVSAVQQQLRDINARLLAVEKALGL